MIGLGSMGLRHVKGFLQEYDCQMTAVCDVDAARRKEAAQTINEVYGDNGAHDIDIAHWGMDCDYTGPLSIEGTGEFPSDGLWNASMKHHLVARYANSVEMFIGDRSHYSSGVRWIGEKGWVYANRDRLETSPKDLLSEKLGRNELGHRQGHRRNFLDCVKTRGATVAPIEVAHRSITVAHLGNIAMILGRKIRWNPGKEEILDDPAATRMLSVSYRKPWVL